MYLLTACRELCSKLTQGYDKSHDLEHHELVLKNVLSILETEPRKDTRTINLTCISALLHDTIDDKYCSYEQKLQKQAELHSFLEEYASDEVDNILWIINNISFSKEKKRGYPAVHDDPEITLALRIVSDADKIEALGVTGIQRMLDFNMGTPSDTLSAIPKRTSVESMVLRIKEHTEEKLALLKDHYIHTVGGKRLAKPLHDEMMDLVNDTQRLTEMVQNDGRFV